MLAAKIKSNLHPEPWQLNYMFNIGTRSWLIHFVVVTFVYEAMNGNGGFFSVWYGAMLGTTATVLYVCWAGARLGLETRPRYLRYLGGAHTGLVILVGIIWGVGAIKAAEVSYGATLFFSLALGGTALGAVSSQSAVTRSCLSSIWTALPLLAFANWDSLPDATGRHSAGLILLFAVILTLLAGRMKGLLISVHDLNADLEGQVAELKQTSAALERARRAAADANASKSRFMVHASHDLRQPLHAIGLLNNNLRYENMSAFAEDTVNKIGASVANMSELFRALLDFSALELGQVQVQKSHFNLKGLLDEIAARNIAQARQKKSDIRVSAAPCWVDSDRVLLTNIIQNLVSNAIKYAPGTPILLRAVIIGKTATVSVLDQGDGIPAAEIEAVFKEYYQLEGKDAQKIDGLGLGLALVQRFSHVLGLDCTIAAGDPQGTTVEISGLDVVLPDAVNPQKTHAKLHPLAGLKVHVVDEDVEIAAATVRLLARWGCVATSSAHIPRIRQGLDFLITDFHLGQGCDGAHCVAQVRQLEGRCLPAMIVTGQQNITLGALNIPEPIGLLEKPATPQRIRSLMLSQLSKQKARYADQGGDQGGDQGRERGSG